MQTTDDGTYLELDGRPAVRFERVYPHPVERVWRAITDPEELRHWFPSPEVTYEPRPGGSMTLAGDPYAPEPRTSRVLVWEPPTRFSFEWEDDELHFTLSAYGDGCRLELVDVLSSEGAASRNAAGWEMCLADLERRLRGAARGTGSRAEFEQVLAKYRDRQLPDDGWLPDEPT